MKRRSNDGVKRDQLRRFAAWGWRSFQPRPVIMHESVRYFGSGSSRTTTVRLNTNPKRRRAR